MTNNLNGLLEKLESFANEAGIDLLSKEWPKELFDILESETRKKINDPIFVYGKRLENIFFEMVKALNTTVLIKKENEEAFYSKEEIVIPDFKIFLENGTQYYIEVKNYSPKTPISNNKTLQYSLTKDYKKKLSKFSKITGAPIKIAIFWRTPRIWTLNRLEDYKLQNGKYTIHITDALQFNEMHELGDKSIATESPLIFRLKFKPTKLDPEKSRQTIQIKIKEAQLISNQGKITNKEIKNLAFHLFWFGEWSIEGGKPIVEDGFLVGLDFIAKPEETNTDQNFDRITFLSVLYTNIWCFHSERQSCLPKISTTNNLPPIEKIIPRNPFNKGLPLWIFTLLPKKE